MTSLTPPNTSMSTRATSDASLAKPFHLEMPEPRFLSIVPPDADSSSPDEQDGGPICEEDVQSVVGVSISRAQTRLVSPQTPAAEKVAVMGGLDGSGIFDFGAGDVERIQEYAGVNEEPNLSRDSSEEQFTPTTQQHSVNLPSPWRAEPRSFEGVKPQSLDPQTTEPMSMSSDMNARRYFSSFSLPSLPKAPSFRDITIPSLSSILSSTRSRSPARRAATGQKRASTFADMRSGWIAGNQSERRPSGDLAAVQKGPAPQVWSNKNLDQNSHIKAPHDPSSTMRALRTLSDTTAQSPQSSRLHRSTSDQSLTLRRATSTGSSLGDDSRWENVQDQVNSRMKAIKDSLQDSSIRLPRMPDVSNLNFDYFRPDFTRPRAQSEAKRPMRMANRNAAIRDLGHTMHGAASRPLRLSGIDSALADKRPKLTHPYLEHALEHLTGDLVVIGGYRGSILRSAKPPNRQLWVPIKVGLNIRKVDLEVGLQPQDEENMNEHIYASGMLSHIGPVDMGRRLLKRLRACKNARDGTLRVHDYGYDWRLSPHLQSRRLIEFLENLQCNADDAPDHVKGATIIAHSMGGLITRHSVNQRPELFSGVIFAGVPQHCVNILGPLRNGDEVLLSSDVLTAQVNFTFRSSFVLLPEDGRCFINTVTKEEYPVNFFNVKDWIKYAWSPCIAPALPPAGSPENRGLLSSMVDMIPSFPSAVLPSRKSSITRSRNDKSFVLADAAKTASTKFNDIARASQGRSLDPQIGPSSPEHGDDNAPQSTIPLSDALAYLERTLDQTLAFKSEMAHDPEHMMKNRYPPLAVLYANNTPTVAAARVASRDAIRRTDAYDNLQFGSGDGVCLARAAMLPPGYICTKGGKVKTERGHVGLLGDLEAIGRLLAAVIQGRRMGTGLGLDTGRQ